MGNLLKKMLEIEQIVINLKKENQILKNSQNMIVSKEIQKKEVDEYLKNNSVEKTEGFICGMNKAFEIIDKIEKERKEMSKNIDKWVEKKIIMTPKEKAKELVNKYLRTGMLIRQAQQCAFIAVNEILKDNPNIYDSDRLNWKYWTAVNSEIEKL